MLRDREMDVQPRKGIMLSVPGAELHQNPTRVEQANGNLGDLKGAAPNSFSRGEPVRRGGAVCEELLTRNVGKEKRKSQNPWEKGLQQELTRKGHLLKKASTSPPKKKKRTSFLPRKRTHNARSSILRGREGYNCGYEKAPRSVL